jgi:hypothetical protein
MVEEEEEARKFTESAGGACVVFERCVRTTESTESATGLVALGRSRLRESGGSRGGGAEAKLVRTSRSLLFAFLPHLLLAGPTPAVALVVSDNVATASSSTLLGFG